MAEPCPHTLVRQNSDKNYSEFYWMEGNDDVFIQAAPMENKGDKALRVPTILVLLHKRLLEVATESRKGRGIRKSWHIDMHIR